MRLLRLCAILSMFPYINSCATINVGWKDPELHVHLNTFLDEGAKRGSYPDATSLKMSFDNINDCDQDGCTVGYCYGGNDPEIVIDSRYWANISEPAREELMYHELGHCLLDRGHCNIKDTTGRRLSIMDEYTLNPFHYAQYRTQYVDELFNPDPRCPKHD